MAAYSGTPTVYRCPCGQYLERLPWGSGHPGRRGLLVESPESTATPEIDARTFMPRKQQGFGGLTIFLAVLVFAGLRSLAPGAACGAWNGQKVLAPRRNRTPRYKVAPRGDNRFHSRSRGARCLQRAVGRARDDVLGHAGLLLVLATPVGVPDTLTPATLLSMATAGNYQPAKHKPAGAGALAPARARVPPRRGRNQHHQVPWPTLATGPQWRQQWHSWQLRLRHPTARTTPTEPLPASWARRAAVAQAQMPRSR